MLVTAAIVAIALVPMVVAYLQLGYHADVEASADHDRPARNAEHVLNRAVDNASGSVAGEYEWEQRVLAADAVNRTLDLTFGQVEQSRLQSSIAYEVRQNSSAAVDTATDNCPRGPDRAFGSCETRGGIVVQERAGETHILAVALDVRVTSERGRTDVTFVVGSVGDSVLNPAR